MSSFLEKTKAMYRNSIDEAAVKRAHKQVLSSIEKAALAGESSIVLTKFAVKTNSDCCVFQYELRESECSYLVNELRSCGFFVTHRDPITLIVSGWNRDTDTKPTPITV